MENDPINCNTHKQRQVLKLSSTRVRRTYYGGAEIEKWQGMEEPKDGELPEVWLGSTVQARNPGMEDIKNEGLSKILIDDQEQWLLKDVIEKDPAFFLGGEHYKKYGCSAAVLAKIIDSLSRLTLQVHPDKEYAKKILQSDYGKTEAWYILGGRRVNGKDPYILLGFKPGITRKIWKEMFDTQNIKAMLESIHKIYVKPGEVYFIEGGIPHAIGSGCFLMEIQEPTDYTMRVERITPEGNVIPDQLCHQGVGFDKMLDCFHYGGLTLEETLSKWKIAPEMIFENSEARDMALISEKTTDLFRMRDIRVNGNYEYSLEGAFNVAVVVSGKGILEHAEGRVEIEKSDILFIPAALGKVTWKAGKDSNLNVVLCLPPKGI